MNAPERIHITLNAADGWEKFEACGIRDTHLNHPTPQQINTMLFSQAGKLFRLSGLLDNPTAEVTLSVEVGSSEGRIKLRNHDEPDFISTYEVASQPPPSVVAHGDYQFDLVNAVKS